MPGAMGTDTGQGVTPSPRAPSGPRGTLFPSTLHKQGDPALPWDPPSRALPPSPVWGEQQHLLRGRKGVRGPPPTLAEPTSSSGSCLLDGTATLEATQAPALSQPVQHPYGHSPRLRRTESSWQRVDSGSLESNHDFKKTNKKL